MVLLWRKSLSSSDSKSRPMYQMSNLKDNVEANFNNYTEFFFFIILFFGNITSKFLCYEVFFTKYHFGFIRFEWQLVNRDLSSHQAHSSSEIHENKIHLQKPVGS